MKNFTVLYEMPVDGLNDWMAKPEAERKEAEDQMKEGWNTWMAAHKDSVLNTIGLGKNMRVTNAGVEPVQNSMMLSSYVQAESLEAAGELFKDHPHLQIPGAWIDIMEAKPMEA